MANDDPTSLRMGFGYQQARASGVTGFESPSSPYRMNFLMQWRAAEKKLRKIIERNPSLEPIVREIIAAQTVAGCWSIDQIIAELWYRKLIPDSFDDAA
jgi:hypothetical protein